ncbi:lectin [Lactifluus volemus]|nr:lectin [Lactifluus volemus]
MSYKITARIYQTDTRTFFQVVEKTCWKDATPCIWTEVDGAHVLKMNNSGTCGSLRLVSNTGETFIVTLGIHNDNRWCDIVPNLTPDQTCVVITPEYYDDKYPNREAQRELQLATYSVTGVTGRNLTVNYSVPEGHALTADIVIG